MLKKSHTDPCSLVFLSTLLLTGPVSAQSAATDLARIVAFFEDAEVKGEPELVDCTLSRGTEATCFTITVSHLPQTYSPGPWCPTNISDGAEAGGIWFLDGEAVDVDGAFIAGLAEVYDDTNWQLYDPETGDVRFTGSDALR
ncbi:MAG: hypothetical protein R3E44_12140 [Paracoccaceae bacterium]